MKILWHSVPSCFRTGYGVQTKLFTRELKRLGHDVVISSVVNDLNAHVNQDGIRTLSPGPRGNMGNDLIDMHVDREKPDVLLSLADTFIFDCKKFKKLPWVAWQVVDSEPLLDALELPCKSARMNLAMSHFGQDTMKAAGFQSEYVPLCYDPEEYFPVPQDQARAWVNDKWHVNWINRVVVCANAANMSKPSRKNFGALLQVFAQIKKEIPRAVMYLHTEHTGQLFGQGEDIRKIAGVFNLTEDDIIFPPQYELAEGSLGAEFMRNIYCAADIFISTSAAEGFGVPIVEAQACGLPVVVAANSAQPELIWNGSIVRQGVKWMYHETTFWHLVDPLSFAGSVMHTLKHGPMLKRDPYDFTVQTVTKDYLVPTLEKYIVERDSPTRRFTMPTEGEQDEEHSTVTGNS